MHTSLTSEQVLALAPDPASAKAARGLANAHKWQLIASDARAIWGECQGSGSAPYQTGIDLDALVFRCSCPSRKFPCKHGLALLLLRSAEPQHAGAATRPAWVAAWLSKRDQQAQTGSSAAADQTTAPSTTRRSKPRSDERSARVAAGLDEADRWLRDLVRQGLASAQSQPSSFWSGMAARMIDAQAPGVARRIRDLGGLPASGACWHERMLEHIGALHLLISAYRRIDQLSDNEQWDLRTQIGWSVKQEELASQAAVRDRWLVLGQRVEHDDHLHIQRTWLWGSATERAALVLDFAHGAQPLDRSLIPATAVDAELIFVPSALPQRAFVQRRMSGTVPWTDGVGQSIAGFLATYASALRAMPWVATMPAQLDRVVPLCHEGWFLGDGSGAALPIDPRFARCWELLALSGGHPIAVCSEWDGSYLWPLGASVDGRYRVL